MPFIGLGLHILVALYFAVHALKRGQNMYWLIILFSFPLLGSIVYFFVIYLPELRGSRGVRVARNAFVNMVDPSRELRAAQRAFDMTPTVGNRIRLATALLDAGSPEAALEQYRQAASGPFENDVALLSGMARAQMEVGNPAATVQTLEKLFAAHPQQRQPSLLLLYARGAAACGAVNVRDAFDAALAVADGPEVKCFYADWLTARNNGEDRAKAHSLYEEVVRDSRHWHSHAKSINREWLRHAQRALLN